MKHILSVVAALVLSLSTALAGAPKSYQVTGPVLEVKDDTIIVQKGNDKWEIARDAATKQTGDIAVGSKVTVEYRMTATSIEAKADKAKKK